MQNVYDLAYELCRSLKETDQYKNFHAAKDKVSKDANLSKMINDFQEKNMEFQTKSLTGEQPDPEMMQQIQSLYGIVMADPSAAEYLNAQMAFSTVVNDIFKIIGDAVKDD